MIQISQDSHMTVLGDVFCCSQLIQLYTLVSCKTASGYNHIPLHSVSGSHDFPPYTVKVEAKEVGNIMLACN